MQLCVVDEGLPGLARKRITGVVIIVQICARNFIQKNNPPIGGQAHSQVF
ncbi:hypothetical protein [Photorhabdus sp. CRCIA-P01]|nr:hypothetical protein [Photorhabdus sp. CRCIA-P01]